QGHRSEMMNAVCLLSGGMDSSTLAYVAKSKGYDILALHMNYGQRTEHKELAVEDFDPERADMPNTYVPFRNANLLSIATGFAEAKDADAIFIGVQSLDYSGYPDCRPQFIEAFQKVIDLGTKDTTKITLYA